MAAKDDRRAKLEAEIARLETELLVLHRQWTKKHWLMLFGLLAIPAHLFLGPFFAGIVIVCTPLLVLTQAYLLYVRRAECAQLIDEARYEIVRMERASNPAIDAA